MPARSVSCLESWEVCVVGLGECKQVCAIQQGVTFLIHFLIENVLCAPRSARVTVYARKFDPMCDDPVPAKGYRARGGIRNRYSIFFLRFWISSG